MIFFLGLDSLRSLALPLRLVRFRCRGGMGLLAQMSLHPEVNSQNDGDDGYGAKHQNRKQNLHHHGNSGYQNGVSANAFFARRKAPLPERHSLQPMPQSPLAPRCTLLFQVDRAVPAV
jgi:hypothetical protein